ncbi:MaoC family dehydratase [Cumulibacter manganitolerans]|uniref:MaoC family dehydratase n=1 Tax=Cumulibacter manganitolerans TaxID=1884992 RepID=UPI001294CD50|nr:MaoC family dehydratase [Cumulibacter manganitolerans]
MNPTLPAIGDVIDGAPFEVSRESIRDFCDGSLDYNPLHWDDEYMKGAFGKTQFNGIIMHGMNNFGIISRMLTDWAYERGATSRRIETRWKAPVYPGDTIVPRGTVRDLTPTRDGVWVSIDVQVTNQNGEAVAVGEALVECLPESTPG